ncbi:MAG: ArnT family glycosyltransferase [Marinifilaceae bacterium]
MILLERMKDFGKKNSLILAFATIKLLIHFFTNANYDLHRDEFLYLSQGMHPDWGFMEVPPFIGAVAWLLRNFSVDSVWGIRFLPSLMGGVMVLLVGLMVKEMKGGKWAQALACTAMLVSPAMLRVSWMFQPVIFNVFCWTLLGYLILKYINSERDQFLYALGVVVGFGLLNKYSVAFYLLALLPALLLTRRRALFRNSRFYFSLGIASLIFLPNLIWQWQHNWPVVHHMKELQETQLVNVSLLNFLLDQLVLNLPSVFVWICGLIWLLFADLAKKYRIFGIHFFALLLILMVLRGKSYYTIGVYPLLMAAGGIALEVWSRKVLKFAWIGIMLGLTLPVLPVSLPIYKGEKMVAFFKEMVEEYRLDFPVRWEDGKVHSIPQDYADMMGWKELADKVYKVYRDINGKENCMIYAANYGEAGAIAWYNRNRELAQVVSFNSSFLLWAPDEFSQEALIYIDDEVDDLNYYFEEICKMGQIEAPLAREKGVGIFLCRKPIREFSTFYRDKVSRLKQRFVRK